MKSYPHSAEFAAKANTTPQKYAETYQESVENNEAFWGVVLALAANSAL